MNVVYIVIIALMLFLSAFFSASDMAFSSVNKLRLKKAAKTSKRAKLALKIAEDYDGCIATILFGNDLANTIAPAFATLLAMSLFPSSEDLATTVASFILLGVVLIFGEILPKTIGRTYSFRLALLFAPIIRVLEFVFFPVVKVATSFGGLVAKPFTPKKDEALIPSDDELMVMIDEIEDEGIIDEKGSELLQKSIEFKDTTAEEIMTPRVDIIGYDCRDDLSAWVKKQGAVTRSRIIVYNKFYDHIIGYIPTKSLLKAMLNGDKLDYKNLMLPIIAVPSTSEISTILKLMKKSHHHIAVVKDEYGGTDGIITLEDILEELVGELYDESETVKLDITPTKKRNVFMVSGKMKIDDFFERFNLDRDEIDEDYNTLSGWINDHLGRFAVVGDSFTYQNIDIEVKKTTEYTISSVEVVYHRRRKRG